MTTRWISMLLLFLSALAFGGGISVFGRSSPQAIAGPAPDVAVGQIALTSCGGGAEAASTFGLEDRPVTIAEYIYLHQTRLEGGVQLSTAVNSHRTHGVGVTMP